jgi:large subunit ribosomal protein L6
MSRVGKKPIEIPSSVKVKVEGTTVFVEGTKGKLDMTFPSRFSVAVRENKVTVKRPSDVKEDSAIHGLIRSTIANMIKGVTEGYKKELEIRGVGYKAEVKGKELVLALGFSHLVHYPIPDGITIKTPKPVQLVVEGIDKIRVGEVASEIRAYYKPEPYKGKGIRYVGEYVRHKAGKTIA